VITPRGWLEVDTDTGKVITRRAKCDCGREFTQSRVAFAFMDRIAKARGEAAATAFMSDIPN
jgi:hypothetical protein